MTTGQRQALQDFVLVNQALKIVDNIITAHDEPEDRYFELAARLDHKAQDLFEEVMVALGV
jgi:hypothetical protein